MTWPTTAVFYSPKVNCRFPESDSFEKYESQMENTKTSFIEEKL